MRRARTPSMRQLFAATDRIDAIPASELAEVSPLSRCQAICALTGYPNPEALVPLVELRIAREVAHAVE